MDYGLQGRVRTSFNFQKVTPYLPPDIAKKHQQRSFFVNFEKWSSYSDKHMAKVDFEFYTLFIKAV